MSEYYSMLPVPSRFVVHRTCTSDGGKLIRIRDIAWVLGADGYYHSNRLLVELTFGSRGIDDLIYVKTLEVFSADSLSGLREID